MENNKKIGAKQMLVYTETGEKASNLSPDEIERLKRKEHWSPILLFISVDGIMRKQVNLVIYQIYLLKKFQY